MSLDLCGPCLLITCCGLAVSVAGRSADPARGAGRANAAASGFNADGTMPGVRSFREFSRARAHSGSPIPLRFPEKMVVRIEMDKAVSPCDATSRSASKTLLSATSFEQPQCEHAIVRVVGCAQVMR